MTTPEFPRTSGKHTNKHPHAQGAHKLHAWGCLLFSLTICITQEQTNKQKPCEQHTPRRKKTNIMNWRTLLLLAFLLPLSTGLAAQKKEKEKEKAEQPKIEMTFQEKIKPLGPPPIREKFGSQTASNKKIPEKAQWTRPRIRSRAKGKHICCSFCSISLSCFSICHRHQSQVRSSQYHLSLVVCDMHQSI